MYLAGEISKFEKNLEVDNVSLGSTMEWITEARPGSWNARKKEEQRRENDTWLYLQKYIEAFGEEYKHSIFLLWQILVNYSTDDLS